MPPPPAHPIRKHKLLLFLFALVGVAVSSTQAQTIAVNNINYEVANMASFTTDASTSFTFTVGSTYTLADKLTFELSSGSFSGSLGFSFNDSAGGSWGLLNTSSTTATFRRTSGSGDLISGGTLTIEFGGIDITGASDPLLVSGYGTYSGGGTIESFAGVTFATTASAVPEPSTYAALAGLAMFGYVVIRRRRMHTA